MAPGIFSKLFKRKRELPKRYPQPRSPDAIGISDSTCEVNGDLFDKWKLPIPPPEERQLKLGARPCNPQHQSHFFNLPPEIREMIYLELLGGRRVHIDYAFKWPSPFRPQPNEKQPRCYWQWWHHVCQESDSFAEDPVYDRCSSHVHDDIDDVKRLGWTTAPSGMKIVGVEWLRSCQMAYQETIPILYGTNVFDMGNMMDTPFHMSRLLLPNYTSLITAMDVVVRIGKAHSEPPEITGICAYVYPAFFELFHQTFRNVRRLRLTMHLKPWDIPPVTMNDKNLDAFLAPWETLARSREWIYLNLCVQHDWYPWLKKKEDTQSRWTLSKTDWCERLPCDYGI